MRNSFKLFLKELLTSIYSLISLLLFLFDYFAKPFLPKKIKGYISLDLILITIIILIILAGISAFHKLRMARLNELYKYLPEANKDRIFRIFYELYKEGEFLKQASVERRQTWDEEALKELRNYCTEGFISIYLRNTNRRFEIFIPLDDKYYDTALANIKRLLDENLDHFVKF